MPMYILTTTILSQFILIILYNVSSSQSKLDSIILRRRSTDSEYEREWRQKIGNRQISRATAVTSADTEYIAAFGFVVSNPLVTLLFPSISFREKRPATMTILQKREKENAMTDEGDDNAAVVATSTITVTTTVVGNGTYLSNNDADDERTSNGFQVVETHERRIMANNSTSNRLYQMNNNITATSPLIEYLPAITTPFFDNLAHNVIAELQQHVQLIKPGTKWCGDGNRARSYEDVGVLYKTDRCCRTHDKCPIYILSQETKYGLHNEALWTRSHCDCDTSFYDCLKNVKSPFSTGVGITYFNILKMKCFRYEHPILMCSQMSGWFSKQCIEYIVDTNKPKQWQWFDNREF